MHTYIQDFKIIRYETKTDEEYSKMLKTLEEVFASSGVPKNTVEYVIKELTKTKRTNHATVGAPERIYFSKQLKSNKVAMEFLIRLYYYDFILFGYPIPDVPQ